MDAQGSRSGSSSNSVEAWRHHVQFSSDTQDNEGGAAEPPAYSPVEPNDSNSDFCCAFRKLNECIRDSSIHLELMRKPRPYLILCWVALCRANDVSLSAKDRFKCPMTWCDAAFAENEHVELINHVSGCSRLQQGQYTCPYCHKPEFFMVPGASSEHSHLRHRSRRHFLKSAFTSICRLGSKGLRKTRSPVKPQKLVRDSRSDSASRKRPYQEDSIETTSVAIQPPPLLSSELSVDGARYELDGGMIDPGMLIGADTTNAVSTVSTHVSKRLSRQSVFELSTTNSTLFDLETLPDAFEPETPVVAELASVRFSYPSLSGIITGNTTPESHQSPVSPVTDQWLDASDFDSPVSASNTLSLPFFMDNLDNEGHQARLGKSPSSDPMSHVSEGPSPITATNTVGPMWPAPASFSGRKAVRHSPNIRIDTGCAPSRLVGPPKSSPTFSDSSNSTGASSRRRQRPTDIATAMRLRYNDVPSPLRIEAESRSPIKLVEELRGLFNSCFKTTCAKLSQQPMSAAAAAMFSKYPSPAYVFEKGYQALHKFFSGATPASFWEVFGLAHLSYASALATQEGNIEERLAQTYMELRIWGCLIRNEADRNGYLQLIEQVFAPENLRIATQTHGRSAQAKIGSRYAQVPLLDAKKSVLNTTAMGSSLSSLNLGYSLLEPPRLGMVAGVDSEKKFAILKKGLVIQHCAEFLNEFEYQYQDPASSDLARSHLELEGQSLPLNEKTARTSYIIRKEVIDQLLVIRGVEGFRPVIDNAATQLSETPQMTLREIELFLLQEGKAIAKSQSIYQKFVAVVMSRCDRASMSIGWELPSRDHFYARDIGQVLAIHNDMLINQHAAEHRLTTQAESARKPQGISISSSPARSQQEHISQNLDTARPFPWTATPSSSSASPSTDLVFDPSWPNDLTPAIFEEAEPGAHQPSQEHIPPPYPPPSSMSSVAAQPMENLQLRQPPPQQQQQQKSRPQPLQPPHQPTSSSSNSSAVVGTGTGTGQASPTSSESIEGTLVCHICGKVLQGKLIYLPSNMKRHIRELHSPAAKRLVCKAPGCGKTFIRNHNLQHHQRTVHQTKR